MRVFELAVEPQIHWAVTIVLVLIVRVLALRQFEIIGLNRLTTAVD